MRIVSWNVNSVRLRLDQLARLVDALAPDVVCLQETKVADPAFPHLEVAAMGFAHRHVRGMKSYNGVAILSRLPLAEPGGSLWCGREDCRHVSAALPGGIELHNFYIPAGGPDPDPQTNPKFAHKLAFLDELAEFWAARRQTGGRRILVGDLNVAPLPSDVWDHEKLKKVVTHTEPEVRRLEAVQRAGGWVDAARQVTPAPQPLFTWWSYRAADWQAANRGRRLDHAWVSEDLAGVIGDCFVYPEARHWTRPSDHAPVVLDLLDADTGSS